jgi:hypothetical protein
MAETPGSGAGAPDDEYRQLQRNLTEKVLDRAIADPQWRQRYLDEPQAATAEFPEAQRLRQIEEQQRLRQMEEERQRSRNLNEKVLDKAASDAQWKRQLLANPEAAMRELSSEVPEVSGQVSTFGADTFTLGGLSLWGRRYYDVWFPTIPTDAFMPGDPI